MREAISTRTLIRFGPFELDVAGRQLSKRGRRLKIQDLPFRLLVALLEQPGTVVTRDQLRGRLWGETAVEVDDGLHTAVRKLREVLGDSATQPRYIGTVPRQGYCFLAAVSAQESAPEQQTPEEHALEVAEAQSADEPPAQAVPAAMAPVGRPGRSRMIWIVAPLILALVSGSLLVIRYRNSYGPPSEVLPITSYRGSQESPTLSPDGSRVAFSWVGESGDNPDLYVQRIGGAERIRLTNNPALELSPAWSPSGGTIAFIRDGQLFTLPATGGGESRLTTATGPGLSWSPDSRQLAFSDRVSKDGRLGIFLISVDSGKRQLLSEPGIAGEDLRPAFAPDGQSVAFVRSGISTNDVYRVAVSGGRPVRVARPGIPPNGLVWTPDGRYLLFSTGRFPPGLLVIPAGARDATQLTRLEIAGFSVHEISIIGRNGGREMDLAYAQQSTDWDLFGAAIGRGISAPVSLAASNRAEDAPSFSPDGKMIAFSSSRSGYEEIWVSMADGSQPRQLTRLRTAVTTSPKWSPDGRWIAFNAAVSGNSDVYSVQVEGGAPLRLTSEPSAEVQPNWSHDGRWIYFMSDRGGRKQVWKMPAGGGPAVQVTREGGSQAFESEDGRFVYYVKDGSKPGIWRLPVNGGSETLFSAAPRQNFWTLAGGGLYYFDVDGRLPQLFARPGAVPLRRIDLATLKTTTVGTVEARFPTDVSAVDVTRDEQYLGWVNWPGRSSELILIRNLHIAP